MVYMGGTLSMPTSSNRKAISATLLPPQALLHGQGIVRVEVL